MEGFDYVKKKNLVADSLTLLTCVQEWAGVKEIREVLAVLNLSSREEGSDDEKR